MKGIERGGVRFGLWDSGVGLVVVRTYLYMPGACGFIRRG